MNKSGTAASWHLCWHLALVSDIPITAGITQNAQQARPVRIVDRLRGHMTEVRHPACYFCKHDARIARQGKRRAVPHRACALCSARRALIHWVLPHHTMSRNNNQLTGATC